jgi:hypothetical protein
MSHLLFITPVRAVCRPHRITKEWKMKLALVLVVLFWSGLAMADGPNLWTVAVQGSDRPYLCNECGLATPLPDATSAQALNTWKSGQSPFAGPVDMKGVYRPLQNGDKVSLCNQTGCSTYTWEQPVGWSHGVFQQMESHPG